MTRLTADWVTAPTSRAVMDALCEGYFVGGCVRNALLEAPVADIDIATPVVPDEVVTRLEAAGLKAVPTGIAHGTVTAVLDGGAIEVTTFRADVETFGRHATVAYTTDMAVDAGRRDFTMNALYADAEGTVIDPLGGLPDLHARHVRFIGTAQDRIREDYLRILRFFRFHAWYGADGIDADGLTACAELAEGIDDLARERVGWEVRKLLSASDPAPAVASMAASGVLMRCLPGAAPAALAPLVHLEQAEGLAPDWHRRLVALGGGDREAGLRLSRAEVRQLGLIAKALEDPHPACAAYRHGAAAAEAAVLVLAASAGTPPARGWRADIARGAAATFPLAAKDLLAAGWSPGPTLGDALSRAETAWIESDFALSRDDLIRVADA